MRSWKVTKTRQGKPKITLYENGQVVLSRPIVTVAAGNCLGRAWAGTEAVPDGQ